MALAPGTRLGSYEIISALGAGGMGEVCRARDTKLDRDVAVKILPEVYVREFTGTARGQVSTAGGVAPVWSFNGRELFFRNGDQLLEAALTFGGSVSASQPQLILARAGLGDTPGFAVAMDGKSFLMPQPVPETVAAPRFLHMIVNWFEELKRLVPAN